MNMKTLIIRLGMGTLVAVSAAVSAQDHIIDLAAADIVNVTGKAVSENITVRHEQFVPAGPEQSRSEARRILGELQLADDVARRLDVQLERRLASQLDRAI